MNKNKKRIIKIISACVCALTLLIGSFAFFTDRVTQSTTATAGNMDLVFTDISSSKTGANSIKSNNEFAIDQSWEYASLVSDGGIINPGDYFDLSYNLSNTGSKSMDVRQQLVLTSSVPLTESAEEYKLTITGANYDTTAVTGKLSADKMSITYDLADITLNGSVEKEDGVTWTEQTYTVRLDFDLMADNAFMDSTVNVKLMAQAKQHRNTTDANWEEWLDFETSVDEGSAYPMLAASNAWYTGKTNKSAITTINLVDEADEQTISTATESWPAAVDADGDGSLNNEIMCYINDTELTIAGDGTGRIKANPDSMIAFSDANASKQFLSLTAINGLNLLDTSDVTTMRSMFYGAKLLKSLDLSSFNTSSLKDIRKIFYGCKSLESINLSSFNKSNLTNTSYMLAECSSLTSLDLSNFNTRNVTDMSYMFYNCKALTSLDLSNFNTRNAESMECMIYGCETLTSLDLSNFNTSNVTTMRYMFCNCHSLTELNLSSFDTKNVTDMSGMFSSCIRLNSLDLNNFNTINVTDMSHMFTRLAEKSNLESISLNSFNTKNVTDMSGMFIQSRFKSLDLSNFDTSNVTDMRSMFYDCNALTSLDLSNFDTSNVTDMRSMFYDCNALTSLDLSNFDTSSVTTMEYMFHGCNALTSLDLSNWDTSNVKIMAYMFNDCEALTTIGDVSNWDTSKVTNMSAMFQWCSKLGSLDVSDWNTSSVTDMSFIFYQCKSLGTIDVRNWDISKVTTFDHFMAHAYLTLAGGQNAVKNWDTSSVTNMDAMFYSLQNSVLDLSHFNTSNVKVFTQMFEQSKLVSIIGLENWDTSNGYDFREMFYDTTKLEELDLSSFDTRKAKNGLPSSANGSTSQTMCRFFGAPEGKVINLNKIILGKNFSLNGDGTNTNSNYMCVFPSVTSTSSNTYWLKDGMVAYAPNAIPDKTAGVYTAIADPSTGGFQGQ